MCPPVSPCRGASIDSRCASCAMHKHFNAWKRLFCGWGTCLLRMETHPLWVGNVPFADGNAAARTFGRAHRRRPYHFSCGSMFQGYRRIVRRWTKSKKGCWRIVHRRTKSRKGCRRTVCRWTKSRKGCWRIVRRWTNTRNVCRRTVCRRTKSRKGCWRTVRR